MRSWPLIVHVNIDCLDIGRNQQNVVFGGKMGVDDFAKLREYNHDNINMKQLLRIPLMRLLCWVAYFANLCKLMSRAAVGCSGFVSGETSEDSADPCQLLC